MHAHLYHSALKHSPNLGYLLCLFCTGLTSKKCNSWQFSALNSTGYFQLTCPAERSPGLFFKYYPHCLRYHHLFNVNAKHANRALYILSKIVYINHRQELAWHRFLMHTSSHRSSASKTNFYHDTLLPSMKLFLTLVN